jgi:hypothetical protein
MVDYEDDGEDESVLTEEDSKIAKSGADMDPEDVQGLGPRLQSLYREYKDARKDNEDQWILNLRQFLGQYDPDTLAKLSGARSKIFVGLTRTKVMSAFSRLTDLLFQPGQDFWSVAPTPVPELDPLETAEIVKRATAEVMEASGAMVPTQVMDVINQRKDELIEDIRQEINERAATAADEMTLTIRDQLSEANTEQKLKEAIMEACIFGTGCVKSGTVRIDRTKRWKRMMVNGVQTHALMIKEEVRPEIESVSIFDIYPDPYATSNDDIHGLFRRHVLTRRQFRELRDLDGFDGDAIAGILEYSPAGNYIEEDYERIRREVANIKVQSGPTNRFEVLEYWGSLNVSDLRDAGVDVPEGADDGDEFDANVWICDGKVIRAMLNPIPDGRIPYNCFPYERNPHQFWGTGVPAMMRDSQQTMNAATRIFIDNMAISSGPMVEINSDFLEAGEDARDLHPWKVWLRSGGDPNSPMVRFHQPIANANGLSTVIDMFRKFADETTSLPSYTHGDTGQSLNKTATGMSILMGNANVALKSTLKNLDDFLVIPLVKSLYNWNMEWSENERLKGDLKIEARGSTSLIQREVRSQRLLQFLQLISNPVDMQITKRQQLLTEIAKSMDINPAEVFKTERELAQEAQQQMLAQGGGGGDMALGAAPMGGADDPSNGAAGSLPGQIGERSGSQI